ncbi:hypothetical protein GCM10010145_49190 [Streptomyces ruber]|uniref:Uncharacterized protein n=2 Tax=Streptomyces TaxID=1883 RepID=A0A918EUH9_9ACTN|nr:hypothetical protein GCM10010145_49190 [Streptomyces ruber]
MRSDEVQSVLALLGAILGGTLVLFGDFIRRRVERHKEEVNRLVEVSVRLSSMYNRLCGQLLDASTAGVAVSDLAVADPLRYEVTTQFFMTPGSEQLRSRASRLMDAYYRLRDSYGQDSAWDAARDEHGLAVREFEAAVRAILHRNHI